MPRSIAEVNAVRQADDNSAVTGSPEHSSGRHGYDPNQPRVPAGHSYGGRWTKTGAHGPASRREVELDDTGDDAWDSVTNTHRADGTLAEQEVVNRDGSRIHSQFSLDPRISGWDERHTVTLPDGQQITFENNGDTQTIYGPDGQPISASTWTSNGPEPEAIVQPAFVPAVVVGVTAGVVAARAAVQAALVLGTWLAGRNGPDGTAVVSFPLTVYQPNADGELRPVWVGRLTDKELEDSCPKYKKVQAKTDTAAGEIGRANYPSAATYGTAVHWALHNEINHPKDKKEEKDPDLHSEVSYLKTLAETKERPDVKHGQKGSIRVDVLEDTNKGAVCVYDIKTGISGLYPGRSREIAKAVYLFNPHAQRIFVIEMRPNRSR